MKNTSSFYRSSGLYRLVTALFCLIAGSAALARSQAPAPVPTNAAAVTAMQDSLDKQRAAVQRQMSQTSGQGFFVLPRPASMGATTPGPALAMSSVSAALPVPPMTDCSPLGASAVESLVGDAASREGLDSDLLRGVMRQESGF